ncbi:MAG TPA: fibronectin type III domain-containing protein [Candidatus Saccharimonadales bacterium]|nr:fibronectin type III domain-containing protein [Candidatus Saccharimonadales bacterium]
MNCSYCNEPNPTGEAFCSNCGASQGTNAPQGSAPVSQQGQHTQSFGFFCPSCKVPLIQGDVRCFNCNAPVQGTNPAPTGGSQPAQPSQPMTGSGTVYTPKDWNKEIFCVCCGKERESTSMSCTNSNCVHKQVGFANTPEWNAANIQHQREHVQPTAQQLSVQLPAPFVRAKPTSPGDTQISLEWRRIPGAERIWIYKKDQSGKPQLLEELDAKDSTFIDTLATPGQNYYIVRAVDPNGLLGDPSEIDILLLDRCRNCGTPQFREGQKFCTNCRMQY